MTPLRASPRETHPGLRLPTRRSRTRAPSPLARGARSRALPHLRLLAVGREEPHPHPLLGQLQPCPAPCTRPIGLPLGPHRSGDAVGGASLHQRPAVRRQWHHQDMRPVDRAGKCWTWPAPLLGVLKLLGLFRNAYQRLGAARVGLQCRHLHPCVWPRCRRLCQARTGPRPGIR